MRLVVILLAAVRVAHQAKYLILSALVHQRLSAVEETAMQALSVLGVVNA